MTSLSHSSGVLQYHPRTATCALSLPLLKSRTQLNTVPHAGTFCPQTADNRRWISDGVTPSLHSNHVVHSSRDSRLQFCNSCQCTRPLVMIQQLFTDMHDRGHWVLECWTVTELKGKHKVRPRTDREIPEVGNRYGSTLSLTSALGWMVSTTSRPLYSLQKGTVAIEQESLRAPGPVWKVRNISPLPGFDPWTVQPAASPYTD